jgi:hypothetical protein
MGGGKESECGGCGAGEEIGRISLILKMTTEGETTRRQETRRAFVRAYDLMKVK